MLKFHAVIFAEKSYVACFPSLERTEVVQNFPQVANLRRLRGQPKFRQFTVGYIGAISLTRGFGETLEVLSSLDKQGLSIAFECIGPLRPEAATYFEHWKTRNLDTSMRVNLRGFMPAEEGLKTIARCQVGLALLQPSPNYLGSYPTKIFEYMALGIPFITSNFPLYQEIVETYQCGICVDPLDKLQVANAIQKLASDNNLLEEMGRKGIEAAESTFSWDREESKLLEFYRNVLRV
jgi:glycosyltransferase involved in cell wall biosynthesis